MRNVSELAAIAVADHCSCAFGVVGNGNAHFVDALLRTKCQYVATRHEAGAIGAADAYARVAGTLAVATTTYGAGFTNAITALAEATFARSPLLLLVGAQPTTGPRPWDIKQDAIATHIGVSTITLGAGSIKSAIDGAVEKARGEQRPVIVEIPYDLATSPGREQASSATTRSTVAKSSDKPKRVSQLSRSVRVPDEAEFFSALNSAVALMRSAVRPLVLGGRGALLANAGRQLAEIAARLGAPTATTALARSLFVGSPWDLGIAGGFSTVSSAELIATADVVFVVGAGLNQFTTRFDTLFAQDARVIQINTEARPTASCVTDVLCGDASVVCEAVLAQLPGATASGWRDSVMRGDGSEARRSDAGEEFASDGRLDPRYLLRYLNEILPSDCILVQDIGHSIGWAPMYLDLPAGAPTVLMGTAYQSIGLAMLGAIGANQATESTVVVGMGDGSALMSLADLDTLVRVASSCVVIVYNDKAYGAEIHQYASQGLEPGPMQIEEVDFAAVTRGLGGDGEVIRSVADLDHLTRWVSSGAKGLFLLDCRVSATIVAPFMTEIAAHVRAHDEGRI
ncbi:thiamine pyrophosphate-binding protein [Spelaeicoccus albus]|uniref:Thiamine pyrophosphate-dependent acetolactate synthase large subunit-like protein n=2 Tax=Spelaeicoccus albus TaxID=1280376 RepID=A0A7Z0IIR3_9MICO|nr:thiamine pyrophosphate-binding protein [Spelaeicoccus albus]NYI68778.1 thiamine pyrophosphate-dependent acetolactate synthase large subunit-like protein [Spelaeicoccus albus]